MHSNLACTSALSMAILPDYLNTVRAEVNAALDRFASFSGDCPTVLAEAIRYSLLAPGKRLRPLLTLMAAEACGCDRSLALPAACALEMVHTYSLIHDDLPAMDDDDMRRGQPSCHAKFGEANAILAGDALLALAFEILSTYVRPPATAARCCAELARAAGPEALVGGQVDDLAAEFSKYGVEALEAIHRRKTGAMFLAALRLGGIVAGASETQLVALTVYGRSLGLAFQIIDDLLDQKGNDAALGKHARMDAERGKLTFPALLGNEESVRRATRLIDDACQAIGVLGEQSQRLQDIARYVLERNH